MRQAGRKTCVSGERLRSARREGGRDQTGMATAEEEGERGATATPLSAAAAFLRLTVVACFFSGGFRPTTAAWSWSRSGAPPPLSYHVRCTVVAWYAIITYGISIPSILYSDRMSILHLATSAFKNLGDGSMLFGRYCGVCRARADVRAGKSST